MDLISVSKDMIDVKVGFEPCGYFNTGDVDVIAHICLS